MNYIFNNLLLLLVFSCCDCSGLAEHGSIKSPFLLAKTPETFKFADLQLLEAQLQAKARGNAYSCDRMLLDSATGSSLYWLNFSTFDLYQTNDLLPSSLIRCEWVAVVLAHGNTAKDLVKSLNEQNGIFLFNSTGWALDYTRMSQIDTTTSCKGEFGYNFKTLLCSVAPLIRAPPALDPMDASDQLLLVETIQHGIYLAHVLLKKDQMGSLAFFKSWAKRPFQYSSAVHPKVAEIIVDLILDIVYLDSEDNRKSVHLLDPTCGSGTFLAFALAFDRNISVEGRDINLKCIEGTRENLKHMFGEANIGSRCSLRAGDSSLQDQNRDEYQNIDCVIANLPWGENAVHYVQENMKILVSLRNTLGEGIPCAFVHKDAKLSSYTTMCSLGFEILGEACVPPMDFVLPDSRKKPLARDGPRNELPREYNDGKTQRITVVKTIPVPEQSLL